MSSEIFLGTVNVMNFWVLPNSYVGTLIPSVIILGVEAFERWLGHAGGVSWINALIQVISGSSHTFCHVGTQSSSGKEGPYPTVISDFQHPELWALNFCLQVTQSVELCQNSSLNCLRQGIFEAQCYFLGIAPLEIISFISANWEESGLPGFEF